MRRTLFWLFAITVIVSMYYAAQYPTAFKSDITQWLDQFQRKPPAADSTAAAEHPQKKRKERRKKIPKKLKPSPFDNLDAYARNTPAEKEKDIKTLAAYLKKPAHTDLQKARMVYTWIATHIAYDDGGFNTNQFACDQDSAAAILKSRLAVCAGYSTLFTALASAMGLEVETVSGYSKGYGYQPGDRFTQTDHAWNVVKINGAWKLCDATWGSGSGDNVNGKLVSTAKFDPVWFDTDPKIFVFTHLPEEAKWQCLDTPFTLAAYEGLPEIHPYMLQAGFSPDALFNYAASGNLKALPNVYASEFPIARNNFPLNRSLQKGKAYTFTFESEYLDQASIVDGMRWLNFTKQGNSFSITFTPETDKVGVYGKVNWFDEEFSCYVMYQDSEATKSLARR